MEYDVELTAEDIGEMITIIRVQVLKLHVRPLADALGITEKVLLYTEDGRGPHGMKILKKINDLFPNINVSINVQITKGA